MKLYLLEWDRYSFIAIFKTKSKAQSCSRSYMENIKEIEVSGDIINNELFVIMDYTGDYGGIYSNKEEAQLELDGYIAKGEFKIESVKLLE